MILHGSLARNFEVKGKLDYRYSEGEVVRWRHRDGEHAGIGTIRGLAELGAPPFGNRWIVDIGREALSGYYPYSCILVSAIDLEPGSDLT